MCGQHIRVQALLRTLSLLKLLLVYHYFLYLSNVFQNTLSELDFKVSDLLSKVGKRTKAKIEYEIVSFLNENRNQLPFYHIPALKPVEDSTQDGGSHNSSKKSSKKVSRQESAKQIFFRLFFLIRLLFIYTFL